MGKKHDQIVPTDPNDPNYIRKLGPREMELLKGGARPGPDELPAWADNLPSRLDILRRR